MQPGCVATERQIATPQREQGQEVAVACGKGSDGEGFSRGLQRSNPRNCPRAPTRALVPSLLLLPL